MTDHPHHGIRVRDLSRLRPGPYCTLTLSDLGAEVLTIEDPGQGDYLRGMPPIHGDAGGQFLALNRDKRSLVLDLKKPAGRDVFLRLCDSCDVVVEGFRPGVMARLGLSWDVLHPRNPRLVLVSVTGYGQDGPLASRAGHDLDYVALAGVLGLWRRAGEPPAVPGVQLADLVGGGVWGALGAVAALCARERTGVGRHVDVSMTEGALALLIPELGAFVESRDEPRQGSGIIRGGNANYQVYETADGQALAVGALEPKFFAALSAALGRPFDSGDIPAPPARQAAIRAELQASFRTKTRAEWERLFTAHDACVEPVLSLAELPAHPQHAARQVFFVLDDPQRGPLRQTRTPFGRPDGHTPPPASGEHTTEVLLQAGYTADEIAALRRAGVIG
ncbi:MAG: CoA transferase [Deltaproteobacteria bacterium]|nr:CoA transferase [Deltaproteobacteria bacterium]